MAAAALGDRASAGVLPAYEAQSYIEHLEFLEPERFGSGKWMQQHEWLEKLNVQAHHNVLTQRDEFVFEGLVSHDKLSVIIRDLLASELWREKCFPSLSEQLDDVSKKSVVPYMILYHEAVLLNLLEVCAYNGEFFEALGDEILDLADYCCRQLSKFLPDFKDGYFASQTIREEMEKDLKLESQLVSLRFSEAMFCVSILRFIIEKANKAPLGIYNLLLNTHDVLLTLIPLLEAKPWRRKQSDSGKEEIFEDNAWRLVRPDEHLLVGKMEGQVWLMLYMVLTDPECRQRYQYESHRKANVLKLKRHLVEHIVDQLPMLVDLRRAVEELQIMDPPEAANATSIPRIEAVPELRDSLLRLNWDWIVDKQKIFFSGEVFDIGRDYIDRIADMYGGTGFDEVLAQPKCATCGKDAEHRCSKCKSEWYCSRKCQLAAWKAHKPHSMARWKDSILSAIAKHQHTAYPDLAHACKFVQLATADENGNPHCRTVVFRGFLDAEENSPRTHLQFATDVRSNKVQQLRHNNRVEVCWYLPETREQFRLKGRMCVFGDGELIGQPISPQFLSSAFHEECRVNLWRSLSAAARKQYEDVAHGSGSLNRNADTPHSTFGACLFMPTEVHHLQLTDPPNALLYTLEGAEWIERRS